MKIIKGKVWAALLVSGISTVLAFIAIKLGIASLLVSLLPDSTNMPKDSANSLYDYYCLRTYQENAEEDSEVILVNIADYPREIIGKTVSTVSQAGAKVIGIDACFENPQPGDTLALIQPFAQTNNLILGLGLIPVDDSSFSPRGSYFAKSNDIEEAVTNLYEKGRKVATTFSDSKNREIPSFDWAVARKFLPDLDEKEIHDNYINYMDFWYDNEYTPYDAQKLANCDDDYYEDFCQAAEGKIVLLGVLSDHEDLHYIPSGDYVPGLLIHAFAISSIIHNKTIKGVPSALLWTVSFLICFTLTILYYYISRLSKRYLSWIFKGVEILVMILLLFICIRLFRSGWFIDITPYFTIFAFQLFVLSIKDPRFIHQEQ